MVVFEWKVIQLKVDFSSYSSPISPLLLHLIYKDSSTMSSSFLARIVLQEYMAAHSESISSLAAIGYNPFACAEALLTCGNDPTLAAEWLMKNYETTTISKANNQELPLVSDQCRETAKQKLESEISTCLAVKDANSGGVAGIDILELTPVQLSVRAVSQENPGKNYCFLNTFLQQLKHTPYLADYLLNGYYRNDLRSDIQPHESLAVSLSSFLQLSVSTSSGEVISPEHVHTALGKAFRRFDNYDQHDATEATSTILARLAYETSSVDTKIKQFERQDGESVLDYARRYYVEYKSMENNSPLVRMTHCVLVTETSCNCSKCGHSESQKCDILSQLDVEIPTGGDGEPVSSCSMQDLLHGFTKTRKVTDYECPGCKERVDATQNRSIVGQPPMLVVNPMKFRDVRNSKGELAGLEKIDVVVDVSLEVNDLSGYMMSLDDDNANEAKYELLSSANQIGSLVGGHYEATVRDFRSNTFHHFNDSQYGVVSSDRKSNIINNTNYGLMFVRSDVAGQLKQSSAQLPQDDSPTIQQEEQEDVEPLVSNSSGNSSDSQDEQLATNSSSNGDSDADVHMEESDDQLQDHTTQDEQEEQQDVEPLVSNSSSSSNSQDEQLSSDGDSDDAHDMEELDDEMQQEIGMLLLCDTLLFTFTAYISYHLYFQLQKSLGKRSSALRNTLTVGTSLTLIRP